jgi:hypothetical protein
MMLRAWMQAALGQPQLQAPEFSWEPNMGRKL